MQRLIRSFVGRAFVLSQKNMILNSYASGRTYFKQRFLKLSLFRPSRFNIRKMIFTKQASSVRCENSSIENQTLIENSNRPVYDHALWCVRAGRIGEAQSLCRQLLRKCLLEGDALNFYATQCVLSLSGSDEPFVFPNDQLLSSQNGRSQQLLETNAAIRDFQTRTFSVSRSNWVSICKQVSSTNGLDNYNASCFTWLANSVREELAQTSHYFDSKVFELERIWAWAIRLSQKAAGQFPHEAPHALRELAWYQATHESGSHVNQVLRSLRLSVLGAQRMGMANEEAKTLSAWNSMTEEFGFSVPSMNEGEAERLKLLSGANATKLKESEVSTMDAASIANGLSDLIFELNSGIGTHNASSELGSVSSSGSLTRSSYSS
jgi:hypothetical protein